MLCAASRVPAARIALSRATRLGPRSFSPSVRCAAAAMDKVEFGPSKLPGYEAGPKDAPGVIVLQEWWGITPIIKEQALMISKEGFRVLVPDLYKGKIGVDAEEASHLMNSLDFKGAVEELKQAADYLRATGAGRVGAVGMCMGGALAFAAAQHAGIDAAAPFYGIPDPAICQPDSIKIPVQAHFGKLDSLTGFSDPESAQKVFDKMKAAGCDVELFLYDGCGHAFLNALTDEGREKIKTIGQASPPEGEVKAAFERMVAFFKKHLAA
ncbi:carboxymethylenebutenolidase [Raphidocelis subcapitata]|uniref:Carboxymethylenebutenolidase n=1 Tax=Raphidocelis subcapitata TaxID=307507 RepID=A0A2V0P1M3_9CHLO|nr:carboxymethylenebutenolidase [Raphidocelis subcapitata]|eukprot:GBF90985.1 carboxymethylenebutenolidase [Raphidocelis subcapitata]